MTINKRFQIITGISLIRSIILLLGLVLVFYIEWMGKLFSLNLDLEFKDKMIFSVYWFTAIIIWEYTRETFLLRRISEVQLEEAKISSRFLEIQIRPKAYPLLITAIDLGWQGDRMVFIVINPDNFKALFYVRITITSEGKVLYTVDSHWESDEQVIRKPLHVYPGGMRYPEVFNLNSCMDKNGNLPSKIVAEIEYKIAPSNAPSQVFTDYQIEKWKFIDGSWEGPNGIGSQVVKRLINDEIGS